MGRLLSPKPFAVEHLSEPCYFLLFHGSQGAILGAGEGAVGVLKLRRQ